MSAFVKLESPSAERNKQAIWNVLQEHVFTTTATATTTTKNENEQQQQQPPLRILEIAAGSGVHSHFFCLQLSLLDKDRVGRTAQWFPTDPNEQSRNSIEAYRQDQNNHVSLILQPPMALTLDENGIDDVHLDGDALSTLKKESFDLIVCINMIHISPWEATVGLFKMARQLLKPHTGILYCYGPYRENGTAVESNLKFEQWLKEKDSSYGLRNLEDVVQLAESCDLKLTKRIEMPANNLSVLYTKTE